MKKLLTSFILLSSLIIKGQTNPSSGLIIIDHVNVVDVKNALLKTDMAILLKENRIIALGKSNKIKIPKNALKINAADKYLIPGLWDMHVHAFRHGSQKLAKEYYFPLFIANGITGIRDMWTKVDEMPQVELWRRQFTKQPGSISRIGAVGTLVDGSPPTHKAATIVTTADEARHMVNEIKASGIDFVKVYWSLSRVAYFAIADEAKKQHIPFAGHVPFSVSALEASNAGQLSIEHLDGGIGIDCSLHEQELRKVEEKDWGPQHQKLMVETYDEQKAARLFSRFKKNGTWQCPTLVIHSRGSTVVQVDSAEINERLKYIHADEKAEWQTFGSKLKSRSVEQKAEREKNVQYFLAMVGAMHRAGVELMLGTDVGNPFIYPGFSVHDELALFVYAGLTPMEALQTATINPARFLGTTDSLGSIEIGKIADMVLLDANPLVNINNSKLINAVFLNGKYLSKQTLENMLQQAKTAANKNE